ncbi:MAG: nuclear transport factor 2 family protein [Gammaproteobacteria bacterium]|nr:nuclear transport factor 2 family protein [Gammaproteobacteria bacterium]
MDEEQSIMATLEDYATAYCAKDIDALMNVFVDGESISLIGTGGDELCGDREAVKNVFIRNFEAQLAAPLQLAWRQQSYPRVNRHNAVTG